MNFSFGPHLKETSVIDWIAHKKLVTCKIRISVHQMSYVCWPWINVPNLYFSIHRDSPCPARPSYSSSWADNRTIFEYNKECEVGNALTESQTSQWSHGNSADVYFVTLNPRGENMPIESHGSQAIQRQTSQGKDVLQSLFLGERKGISVYLRVNGQGSSLDYRNRGKVL